MFISLFAGTLQAQKDDTVYLINGDRITGELKRYENGLLVLKTDGISTINIEYDKIRTFFSRKNFEIVKKSGFSYFGTITKSKSERSVDICVNKDTVTEPIRDIVELTRIKNRFWNKFYGSVDLGLSYYKSTSTLQYYFNGDLNYRARKDLVSAEVSLLFSEQDVSDSLFIARKNDIGLNYSHFFQGRWWGGIGSKWQQNTELDLDYRLQLGLGAGYDIVHTNPVRFYVLAGFLVNREKPTDSVSFSTNFEGLLSMKFTWLQFRHPKIDISTNFDAFPSFTISNRYRLEYNLAVKYEIFKDFFIGLTFYDDFDSKPSGGGPALNDWSVIFSIGYSF
jgi:sRNA-binding regulator protein Hfq